MDLYDKLTEYCSGDAYPFHMPGHKRRLGTMQDPFSFDITEIDGFDDLHHAEGILLEAEERAASLWGSSETHFLVNGSTCGILSAVLACRGRTLVMARNCHISAYNAAALSGQDTYYLMPHPNDGLNGPVTPSMLESALDRCDDVSAVLVTSPTYDGVVSDIGHLAQIAHSRGVPLIVDEAHGAHFGMHPYFPPSSVSLGADLVIHSLHKTLPSLTQTALIHVNGDLVDRQRLRRMLDIFQTSSPSYVLMASIDRCVRLLMNSGPALFESYVRRLRAFRSRMTVPGIRLPDTDDPSRILLSPEFMSAKELYDILRTKYRLQPEMCCPSYVLMLSSVADDDEGFRRLLEALADIRKNAAASSEKSPVRGDALVRNDAFSGAADCPGDAFTEGADCRDDAFTDEADYPDIKLSIHDALDAASRPVPLDAAAGRISAEYIYLYPPGSPVIAPGELITDKLVSRIRALRDAGYPLKGCADHTVRTLLTCTP